MISFPLGTKMFQFPRYPSPSLCVQLGDDVGDLRPDAGFPHSDIPGSKPAHGSPRLIAVFHVLLRHLTPRHPPCALSSLTQRDAEKLTYFSFFFFLSVDAIQLVRCKFAPACSSRGRRFDRRDGSPRLGSPSRLSIPVYVLRPGVLTGPTDLPAITTCPLIQFCA